MFSIQSIHISHMCAQPPEAQLSFSHPIKNSFDRDLLQGITGMEQGTQSNSHPNVKSNEERPPEVSIITPSDDHEAMACTIVLRNEAKLIVIVARFLV